MGGGNVNMWRNHDCILYTNCNLVIVLVIDLQ